MDSNDQIIASPSKAFFIDMLTRDITLAECILDLIDNSIHNAIRHQRFDVMQTLTPGTTKHFKNTHIHVSFDRASFEIVDNCGGISINDAQKEVFRFGRAIPQKGFKGLGVYGIGMKRAFFKMGNLVELQSRTDKEEFKVTIDVKDWNAKPDDWTFAFADTKRMSHRKSDAGTRIHISELHDEVGQRFAGNTFRAEVHNRIATTYALFIRCGIDITLNGEPVKHDLPDFAVSRDLGITRAKLKHDGVDILILAGVTPASDRTPRGWYIFCNGRMVVDADKTHMTGWHNGRTFNPKYNHFLGWTLFASTDGSKLPWRTTKEGIDAETPVYRAALNEMRALAKPILSFLAKQYPGEVAESVPERELIDSAKRVSVLKIASGPSQTFKAHASVSAKTKSVRIQYDRPRSEVSKIAFSMNKPNMAAARVGEFTFEYYLKNVAK